MRDFTRRLARVAFFFAEPETVWVFKLRDRDCPGILLRRYVKIYLVQASCFSGAKLTRQYVYWNSDNLAEFRFNLFSMPGLRWLLARTTTGNRAHVEMLRCKKTNISRDFETSSVKLENQRQLGKKSRDCETHQNPIKILREPQFSNICHPKVRVCVYIRCAPSQLVSILNLVTLLSI